MEQGQHRLAYSLLERAESLTLQQPACANAAVRLPHAHATRAHTHTRPSSHHHPLSTRASVRASLAFSRGAGCVRWECQDVLSSCCPPRSGLPVLRGKPGQISWHGRRVCRYRCGPSWQSGHSQIGARTLPFHVSAARRAWTLEGWSARVPTALRTLFKAMQDLGHIDGCPGPLAHNGQRRLPRFLSIHLAPIACPSCSPAPLARTHKNAHASTHTQARTRKHAHASTRSRGSSTQEHARASRKLLRQCARIGTPAAVFLHRYYVGRGKARTALGASLALSDGSAGWSTLSLAMAESGFHFRGHRRACSTAWHAKADSLAAGSDAFKPSHCATQVTSTGRLQRSKGWAGRWRPSHACAHSTRPPTPMHTQTPRDHARAHLQICRYPFRSITSTAVRLRAR